MFRTYLLFWLCLLMRIEKAKTGKREEISGGNKCWSLPSTIPKSFAHFLFFSGFFVSFSILPRFVSFLTATRCRNNFP